MLAAQWKSGFGVIEGNRFAPSCVTVASLAFIAKIAPVRLIRLVTAEAISGRFGPAPAGHMAI